MYTLTPRKTIFIKKRELHRIETVTNSVVIEISFGDHAEDDIKRIADDYGRLYRNRRFLGKVNDLTAKIKDWLVL